MAAVADSSPLIYLAALSDFQFLREFFESVLIPPVVYREVVDQGQGFPVKEDVEAALGGWLRIEVIQNPKRAIEICAVGRLDEGESEAIVLAQERDATLLLADDQRCVSYPRDLGITVTRTPAIYGEAKLRGWIPSVREKLDALRKKGFRLKDQDYRRVLLKFGEL